MSKNTNIQNKFDKHNHSAIVLVLGDIGRSPRITNHAISLAERNIDVDFIGYTDSKLDKHRISTYSNIKIHSLKPFHSFLNNLSNKNSKYFDFIQFYPLIVCVKLFKAVLQFLNLIWILLLTVQKRQTTIRLILVQTPPAIPTLLACQILSKLCRIRLIIDQHNFAYTLMFGDEKNFTHRFFVKIAFWYEKLLSQYCDHHFCVSKAMKIFLKDEFNIKADVLYDKPPNHFKVLGIDEKKEFLTSLVNRNLIFDKTDLPQIENKCKTKSIRAIFSLLNLQNFKQFSSLNLEKLSPCLITSSTSQTQDEDFTILFDAIQVFDQRLHSYFNGICGKDLKFADLKEKFSKKYFFYFIITGKGPMKQYYEKQIIAKLQPKLNYCKICTVQLPINDYPRLLSSSNLGISLHTSSSGYDLPMKIVDMFGCGLPVCAINFSCISELVHHEENGLIFNQSDELVDQLMSLFVKNNSNSCSNDDFDLLNKMKLNIVKEYFAVSGNSKKLINRWDNTQDNVVQMILKKYFK